MWLPNFTKYENKECFGSGLAFITPDNRLEKDTQKDLWDTMVMRM